MEQEINRIINNLKTALDNDYDVVKVDAEDVATIIDAILKRKITN